MIHLAPPPSFSLFLGAPFETIALFPPPNCLCPSSADRLTISLKAIHESASVSRFFSFFPFPFSLFPASFSTITCIRIFFSFATHSRIRCRSGGYGSRRISIFGKEEEGSLRVTDNYGDRDLSGGVFEVLE